MCVCMCACVRCARAHARVRLCSCECIQLLPFSHAYLNSAIIRTGDHLLSINGDAFHSASMMHGALHSPAGSVPNSKERQKTNKKSIMSQARHTHEHTFKRSQCLNRYGIMIIIHKHARTHAHTYTH